MGIKNRLIIKYGLASDINALALTSWFIAYMMGGVFGIGTLYAIEQTDGALITPESSPTLAGMGLEYLWVIVALIFVATLFIFIVFGKNPGKPYIKK